MLTHSQVLSEFECSVCLEPYHPTNHKPMQTPCGHDFCLFCFKQLLKKASNGTFDCPSCRRVLKGSEVRDNSKVVFGAINAVVRKQNRLAKENGPLEDQTNTLQLRESEESKDDVHMNTANDVRDSPRQNFRDLPTDLTMCPASGQRIVNWCHRC